MARGGRRAGSRGGSYANRSDLRAALPLNAPEGLPYGERQQLLAAQRAVPMAPAPTTRAATAPGPVPSTAGPGVPTPVPGAAGAFLRPTERPHEPVTAGMALGPGPGPEALGPLTRPGGGSSVSGLLQSLAGSPNATPEVQALASYSQGGK